MWAGRTAADQRRYHEPNRDIHGVGYYAEYEAYYQFRGLCAVQKSIDAQGNVVQEYRYFPGVLVSYTPDSLCDAAGGRGARWVS